MKARGETNAPRSGALNISCDPMNTSVMVNAKRYRVVSSPPARVSPLRYSATMLTD